MKLLLDTHLLLWMLEPEGRLPRAARDLMEDPANDLYYSVVSLWEVAIKRSLRPGTLVDPGVLRDGLIDHGYTELPVIHTHAVAVGTLPWIHKDPFDRLLIAQAMTEGLTVMTADRLLTQYPVATLHL